MITQFLFELCYSIHIHPHLIHPLDYIFDYNNKEIGKSIKQIHGLDKGEIYKWCLDNYDIWTRDKELIHFYLHNIVLKNYFKIANYQFNISI